MESKVKYFYKKRERIVITGKGWGSIVMVRIYNLTFL